MFCPTSACLTDAGETCWSCWPLKPLSGADITIASGTRILLDEPANVGALTITGELSTAPIPLTLRARLIALDGGTWTAGTSTSPRRQPLRVELTGTNRIVDVLSGRLELHGPVPAPVFATLEAAAAGATQLTLASSTNWAAGDELLVTPTGHYAALIHPFTFPDAGTGRTEYVTATLVSGPNLTVSAPLVAERLGILDAGVPLDLRGEVANLTRGIVIAGANDSDWDAGHGARVRAGRGAAVVLDGVRLERAGSGPQRQPVLDVHLMQDAGVVSVTGTVITDTSFRAVMVQSSSTATLRDDVIAKVSGHGVWVTDGIETGNVFERNLITDLRTPASGFAGDGASEVNQLTFNVLAASACGASGFVLANPQNTLRGNVVSDLPGCGYWLSLAQKPRGFARGLDLSPARYASGPFEDNTAHTLGGSGLYGGVAITDDTPGVFQFEDVQYLPQADVRFSAPQGTRLPTTYARTRVLGVQHVGLKFNGDATVLDGLTVWSAYLGVFANRAQIAANDLLLVGRLGATRQPFTLGAVMQMYGIDSMSFTRARVAHFRADAMTRGSGFALTRGFPQLGFDLSLEKMSQLSLTDVQLGTRPNPAIDELDITGPSLDTAGIGGFPGRWWVTDAAYFTQGNTCAPAPSGTMSSGQLCAASGYFGLANLLVGTGAGTSVSTVVTQAELVREIAGTPSVGFPVMPQPGDYGRARGLPVPVGETVRLRLPQFTLTPRRLQFLTWGRPGQSAMLRIAYPATTTFVIAAQNEYFAGLPPGPVTFTAAASLAALSMSTTGTQYFFDTTTNYLYLKLLSDFRGNLPYSASPITITATGPGLP